jgi:SH3 domain-containing protein
VNRPIFFRRPGNWFLALALLALWLLPGIGMAGTMTVTQPNQSLYPDPDFASAPVASVPVGAAVTVLQQSGDWYQVQYQGQSGWINRQAFPAPAASSGFNPLGLLTGAPVKETSSDEVALAGKGFTPEVESSYQQKHPEAKYAEVDQVEAQQVPAAKLQAFISEGGLKP